MGMPLSRILVLRGEARYLDVRPKVPIDDRDILESRADGPSPSSAWGPREFLQNVLDLVAGVGGHATILMIHSGVKFEVDPEAFREWASRGAEDVVTALLEPQRLLPGAPTPRAIPERGALPSDDVEGGDEP